MYYNVIIKTKGDIIKRVIASDIRSVLLKEFSHISLKDLKDDDSIYETLELDSLDMSELNILLELKYNVELNDKTLYEDRRVISINSYVDIINKLKGEKC